MALNFTEDYKIKLFLEWYSAGKPIISKFYKWIPPDANGHKPVKNSVANWITDDWSRKAETLDLEVKRELEGKIIQQKLEMLSRHAETGQEMQNIAIDWLRKNKDALSPNSAVRLLVDGIKVEQGSRGIPAGVDEMMDKSDDEIIEDIKQLIVSSPATPLLTSSDA